MRKAYPTDINDTEWNEIKQYIDVRSNTGRPIEVDLREILNGIFYVLKTGCAWRFLPNDLPVWGTVYWYFNKWCSNGVIETIHNFLRDKLRVNVGRDIQPSAGIIDSQSVKTTELGGVRGYDAGKCVKGRKRHILVDTQGLLLDVIVTSSSVQDRDGAKLLFLKSLRYFSKLLLIWADSAYAGKLIDWVKERFMCKLEIIKRTDDIKGFVLLPRRWVVERTFAWLNTYRRLSKDYERLVNTSENFIYLAMIRLMLKRFCLSKKDK